MNNRISNKEFENVIDAIDSHKAQIFNKLSVMLTDVIKKAMRKGIPEAYTNKTKYASMENPQPGQFIVQIVKSMNSLNKVISNMLHEETRKVIFTSVFPFFIDEIEQFVDQHFIDDSNEEGFEIFKHDLEYLEKEITELAKNISTGQAFIHKIREIQEADLQDFEMEEEEDEDESDGKP